VFRAREDSNAGTIDTFRCVSAKAHQPRIWSWTLPLRDQFAPRSVGSASPMQGSALFDPKFDARTEVIPGQMSKFGSFSALYPSSFVQYEPVSVFRGFEFEIVTHSAKQNPPG
jgi:hypothetical protein